MPLKRSFPNMPKQSGKVIALYVATHNQSIEPENDYNVPIQTGAALAKELFCTQTDDTGMHISEKNREYCELTALYWIWKNSTYSIVGLEHYRRRFLIDPTQICGVLEKYDVIVPPAYYFRKSLRDEYNYFHVAEDMNKMLDVIQELYPDMKSSVETVLNNNMLIPYNMIIAKKEFVDAYCQWLFPLLFELEKRLGMSSRDSYQKRVMGFLAERLFTVYVQWKKCDIYVCPVKIPETESGFKRLKYEMGKKMNDLYFQLRK